MPPFQNWKIMQTNNIDVSTCLMSDSLVGKVQPSTSAWYVTGVYGRRCLFDECTNLRLGIGGE